MKRKTKRTAIDIGTIITGNGVKKTIAEYLQEQEGKSVSVQYNKVKDKIYLLKPVNKRKVEYKDKVIYTRHLTPKEIKEEEIKIMASQSLTIFRYLLAHPKEYFTSKELLTKAGLDVKTAEPTFGRVVRYILGTDPEMLKVMKKGRARAVAFQATSGNVVDDANILNKNFLQWYREDREKRKEGVKAKPEPIITKEKEVEAPEVEDKHTEDELKALLMDEAEKLFEAIIKHSEGKKLQLDINITVRFGLIKN